MIIQKITFRSELPEETILKIARERKPQFEALPGLIQKYYFKPAEEKHSGGLYIWDSMESMMAYKNSELAASIPKAYGIEGMPNIEILDVFFQLRD